MGTAHILVFAVSSITMDDDDDDDDDGDNGLLIEIVMMTLAVDASGVGDEKWW